jgi:hypothetical protein
MASNRNFARHNSSHNRPPSSAMMRISSIWRQYRQKSFKCLFYFVILSFKKKTDSTKKGTLRRAIAGSLVETAWI